MLRADDTDARSGVAAGPLAAGSALMLPNLARIWTTITLGPWTRAC